MDDGNGSSSADQSRVGDDVAAIRSSARQEVDLELDGRHSLLFAEGGMDGVDSRGVRKGRQNPSMDYAVLLRMGTLRTEGDLGRFRVVGPEGELEELIHRNGGEGLVSGRHQVPHLKESAGQVTYDGTGTGTTVLERIT